LGVLGLGQCVKCRALAHIRQAYNPNTECHFTYLLKVRGQLLPQQSLTIRIFDVFVVNKQRKRDGAIFVTSAQRLFFVDFKCTTFVTVFALFARYRCIELWPIYRFDKVSYNQL
jgi:hypothetical protein